jgi:hypothetical protein
VTGHAQDVQPWGHRDILTGLVDPGHESVSS